MAGGMKNTMDQPPSGALDGDPMRIKLLEVGHDHLVEQMSELVVSMRDVRSCLEQGQQRMATLEAELRANSVTTVEVRDILSTARGAFRFFGLLGTLLKWVGAAATAIAAVYVAAYTLLHGGRPPTH